jgi:hypothetical protein
MHFWAAIDEGADIVGCYRSDDGGGLHEISGRRSGLNEQASETGAGKAHVLGKWRLIGWYWIAQAAFVALFVPVWILQGDTVNGREGRPLGTIEWSRLEGLYEDVDVWGVMLGAILGLMVLQAALVWPVRKPRARSERGWSLRLSIGVAALVGTALGVAMLLGAATLLEMWDPPLSNEVRRALLVGFWVWLGVSYILGYVLLRRFCLRGLQRGERHESLLGRIAATLFVGTLVEAAAIMPIDVLMRKRESCYCFAGTYWGYVILLACGWVTLGPAILLPLFSKRRKRWYGSRCECCGYDMTGIIRAERAIDRCPECGAGWKHEPLAQAKE